MKNLIKNNILKNYKYYIAILIAYYFSHFFIMMGFRSIWIP